MFCFIPFISCTFFIYRLSMNVSISLAYFSSVHCFTYAGLYFVLFLDLNNYLSIYWLLAFLFHYFFICLMFVLYINPVCKPLQISEIEYSDGPSIILNLSSSKNIVCFCIHLAIDLCSHCLHLRIYLSMCLSSFFFNSCAECVLLYSLHV